MAPRYPTSAPASLEQRVEVETPEQVVFAYTIAGVGSRTAAAMIDYFITILILIALSYLGTITVGTVRIVGRIPADWATALVFLLLFAAVFLYFVLFEGLNDGQTPGKQALGLRVVQDGGYSVSFAASSVRNLVRIVDAIPGVYAVGLLAVILSRTGKRLGDHAAGTIVVQERAVAVPFGQPAEEKEPQHVPVSASLNDDEYALLERYLARRATLTEERRSTFDLQLVMRLGNRLPSGGTDVGARLQTLYVQEKALRARGVASRSDTGAAREQHAIVATGAARWREFASVLHTARRGGLKKMSEEAVADFVARYREISTDLARLRTASRGRESDAAFYLSRLIGAGHNLLYKQRQLIPLIIWNFIGVAVPGEVRRSIFPIALATLLLFGPAVVTHAVVARDRSTAEILVPPSIIERAENAARQNSYLGAEADIRGPTMASSLVTNNVRVSFSAFGLGITAGVGTILVLFFNGIILGGALGLFASHNVLHLILAFVIPHGVIELMAICVAGGGGLLLGSAFVLPGTLTRREALVVRGRRAIRLISASTILLIFAAIIEGFVSPLNLPLPWAITIGVTSGVMAILYFSLGGRGQEGPPEEEFAYSDERALSSR